MAKAMDTARGLELLGALHTKESDLVARLRDAGISHTAIATAMNSTPQGIAKRFPAAKTAGRRSRSIAAPKPAAKSVAKAPKSRVGAGAGRTRGR